IKPSLSYDNGESQLFRAKTTMKLALDSRFCVTPAMLFKYIGENFQLCAFPSKLSANFNCDLEGTSTSINAAIGFDIYGEFVSISRFIEVIKISVECVV